ncbi:MAG TPA: GNAT family N-acetyltransferase [Candidatus Binatia bacterium]|nr:GNAT family N-acetyltransferase [Candidatus Binatia bacterium]
MIEPDVVTERLVLRSMSAGFLAATVAGRPADGLLGLTVPDAWLDESALARRRLADLRDDPAYAPWSLRAIGLRSTDQMVGHIGFHTRPGPSYLATIAQSGVELGYTVYPAFRRCGYAREAIVALMAWARAQQGVVRFVVSVSPENAASNALAASLGFVRVGSHMDEIDGPEDILLLSGDALAACLPRAAPAVDTPTARRSR